MKRGESVGEVVRLLFVMLFGSVYLDWFRRHRCGSVLLSTSHSERGLRIGDRIHIKAGWLGLRGLGGLLEAAALLALVVGSPPTAIALAIVGLGILVLSLWPETTVFEMRQLALVMNSDLSHVDQQRGPLVIDYEWITDARWDDDGRLVVALSEKGTLNTTVKFARTSVPASERGEVTRILWGRIGKSRAELRTEQSAPAT